MTNQQTLAQAATVEQLLRTNGITVSNFTLTADGQFRLDVDLDASDIDTENVEIGPARAGGGTIKE